MKALRSLVRLHKLRVDEKRKHLAALENRRAAILADQAQAVKDAYATWFEIDSTIQRGDWIRLTGTRRTSP